MTELSNTTAEEIDKVVEAIVENDGQQDQAHPTEDQEEPTPEEINWRKFREGRESDRKQKDAAESLAKEKEDQIAALSVAVDKMMSAKGGDRLTASEQQKIMDDLQEDSFATGGEIKGYMEKNLPKVIESILRSQDEQRREEQRVQEQRDMPRVLRQEHPDFEKVVNQENLDYLDYHYPEIAGALSHLPESKDKWTSVYKAVSKLVPSVGQSSAQRIDQNSQKPRALVGAGSQVSQQPGPSGRLTKEQKDANYRRLLELSRQA